jgi:hypothetical protein
VIPFTAILGGPLRRQENIINKIFILFILPNELTHTVMLLACVREEPASNILTEVFVVFLSPWQMPESA